MAITVLLIPCLGLVITAQAQNCPKPAGGPNMSLKGNDILLDTFPDGTTVSFACNVGYVTAGGSPGITCTAGSWSPVRLQCEKKNCGSAKEIANGYIDYSGGTEFGDKIVAHCNDGYQLVGNPVLYCGATDWIGRLPTCEALKCYPPRQIINGSFSPQNEDYKYREVVQYSCIGDNALNGTKSLTCSEDGTFKPEPPSCVYVMCRDPVVDYAQWISGSRPPYRYKSTVTLQCTSRYTMVGEPTLTCGIGSKWLPALPRCILTTTQATTTTTTTTTTTAKIDPGSPKPTPPSNNGNHLAVKVVVPILVILALVCLGYFGGRALIRKKRGSQKGYSDNDAAKAGEGVPLS